MKRDITPNNKELKNAKYKSFTLQNLKAKLQKQALNQMEYLKRWIKK
ncbi:MAG: hypothetical protein P857_313 [Candidatus Xenolissoclinum pacificiensis L6]|uniref:Uncharacterized protein n=1 Tax=Candidatus Xenolissoclinum pacificiensis L6 TaxID=1401685 RepID=W2V1S4_9RICK|nr:MAG: hypothetical protein P857_313 [Candidatus Xenolissoclinum pacificiensis L6]